MAVYEAVCHFRHFLEGREFNICTYNKPFTSAMYQVGANWTLRVARHLAYISEYTANICHVKGEENTVADTLSRATPQPATVAALHHNQPPDYKVMARAQEDDDELQ